MNTNICENQAHITGEIASPYYLAFTTEEGQCYKVFVNVKRLSEIDDVIPVIVPEFCLSNTLDATGRIVSVAGTFQSRNYRAEGKMHLDLFLYADRFVFMDEQEGGRDSTDSMKSNNCVILAGYLCKKPKYKRTSLGREITDFLLAVNETGTRRSFYIPCITWGRNARLMDRMQIGESVKLEGRIQSREYTKHFQGPDGNEERRMVAHEVSCKHVYAVGQPGEEQAAGEGQGTDGGRR